MSNPLKGEVPFTGTDGIERRLSFSAESFYRLEKQVGVSVDQLGADLRDPSKFQMEMIRTIFWAGLLDTNEGLKLEDVGSIFSKVPAMEAIGLVTLAFVSAFVDPSAKRDASARPPEASQPAAAGTGSPS
ncbi:hypothetical protein [Bradyrhizobium sp. Bra78]|uniref:hypothetical protein n=1 Tax=Bradyrhizobium sp. Bra78 TaxID=2926010 RepID=UPI0021C7B172|nr:hypothetical protein [Bradyrhizobium sp. Bra78]